MIEITHAPEDRRKAQRKIPRNIRQIGNTSGYGKVYMEDMVYQFLLEGGIDEGAHLITYLLLGEDFFQDGEQYIFIRSAMELENISYNREFPVFSEDIWQVIYRTVRKHFPQDKILGWAHNRKGGRLDYCSDMENICRRHFHGENQMVLFFDSVDQEEMMYLSHKGRYLRKEGFHIYYEKNSGFCEYLSDYHDRKEMLTEKRKQERIALERRRLEEQEWRQTFGERREDQDRRRTLGGEPEEIREQEPREQMGKGKEDPRSQAGEELEKRFYEETQEDTFVRRSRLREQRRAERWPGAEAENFRKSPGWEDDTVSRDRDLLREKNRQPSAKLSRTMAAAAAVVLVILGAFAFQNYTQMEDMEDAVDAIAQQQAKEDVLETISKKAGELTQQDGQEAQDSSGQGTDEQSQAAGTDGEQNSGVQGQTQDAGNTGTGEQQADASAQASAQTNEYLAQGYYVVQQGDKLLDISRKVYGNDQMVAAICEANGITDVNHIQAGDRLTLPNP